MLSHEYSRQAESQLLDLSKIKQRLVIQTIEKLCETDGWQPKSSGIGNGCREVYIFHPATDGQQVHMVFRIVGSVLRITKLQSI